MDRSAEDLSCLGHPYRHRFHNPLTIAPRILASCSDLADSVPVPSPLRRRLIFPTLAILIGLILIEGLLWLLAFSSSNIAKLLDEPWGQERRDWIIPDVTLGHRPNPAFHEHDSNGFRNLTVPESVDLVAIGDSQTYGVGVEPDESWPRQFEHLTGQSTYSLAFGGYGPAHSLSLWELGQALEPKIYVEAFYAGNDLYDAFNLVYSLNQQRELRAPDASVADRVNAAEASASLESQISRFFGPAPQPEDKPEIGRLRLLVSKSIRLYGLLRRLRYEWANQRERSLPPWERAKAFAKTNPQACEILETPEFQTILTPAYRLTALELDDPRIAEGLRISCRSLAMMHQRASEQGARFVVLLIPTKELAFAELIESAPQPSPSEHLAKLWKKERQLWAQTKVFLEEQGIEYVEALPALQGEIREKRQPYPLSYDGHPNQHGQRAIAWVLANYLNQPHDNARVGAISP